MLTQVTAVVRKWAQHAWSFFVGPQGYLVFVSLIALYAAVYSLVEARHERRANRASFERSTFMSMVASGNRGTFVAAMKTFGLVQTMTAPRDPELFAPWTWVAQERPNEEPLQMWAASFFPLCTAEACGNPDTQPKSWRIDLAQAQLANTYLRDVNLRDANLFNADLGGADLSDADLREANLTLAILEGADLNDARLQKAHLGGAWLRRADLSDADLRGVDLTPPVYLLNKAALKKGISITVPRPPLDTSRGADLTSATLNKTRLQGVDLRKVLGLTQAQLNTACLDDSTGLPDGLIRPAPCP
jgi:uncharacterized protein YjbI with pentapeptide repeats